MGEESEESKERRHSPDRRDSERIVQDEPRRQREERRDLPDT